MASVVFMYNGVENKINCNINEKIKDIINRYAIQFQINLNNVYNFKLILIMFNFFMEEAKLIILI